MAKIEDLSAKLGDLLHKDFEEVGRYMGTNNAVSDSQEEDIFNKLKSLLHSINCFLPECYLVIRNL